MIYTIKFYYFINIASWVCNYFGHSNDFTIKSFKKNFTCGLKTPEIL